MWKLLLLVQIFIICGSCQVIVAPLNMAVVVGQRLDMMCQPESTFTVRAWVYQLPFNATDLKIYANWSTPRIHIDRFGYDTDSNDSINIYVNSTGPEDAGTYNCFVQLGSRQPDSYSAQVIVLEGEPVCEDVMSTAYNYTLEEGSIVWLRCSLNFRGNLAPTMEWTQHGGSGEIDERDHNLTGMVETTVISDTNITSTLSIFIDATDNVTFFTCKTYFQWDNTSSLNSTATNAPDYSYTWNSSTIILPATTFIEEETTTVSASTSVIISTEGGLSSTFNAFNAIYLVAGVAVLFGIASSLVALIMCLRLRRKNSAALADLDPTEPFASEYDLIPYAITDGYDTIEEVDEKDDILFPNFLPRHGPLPSPGYAALMPDEPKPPGVYSRMEKSVEDEEIDFDEKKVQSDIDRSKTDQSKLFDVEESTKKATIRNNSYLDLTTESNNNYDTAEGEEMPSAYLKMTDDSLQFNSDNKGVETIKNEHPNSYLELTSKSDKEIGEDSDEIPSAYLRMTDDSLQAVMNSNIQEAIPEGEMSSSYLTTREIDSSELQQSTP